MIIKSAILCLVAVLIIGHQTQAKCIRAPLNVRQDKSSGDNGFQLAVMQTLANGTMVPANGYLPSQNYFVTLRGYETPYFVQTFRAFSLVATDTKDNNIGSFMIQTGDQDVRDSSRCEGAVVEATLQPKTRVQAKWRAPREPAGCVLFRAMVLETPSTWYMDDAQLTVKLCLQDGYQPEKVDDEARECCSCDEAKYELMFEGLWSRRSHPKDFPSLVHLTHFSDLIGASHSRKYNMWALQGYASDGLKELAEWGNTYQMQQEMKQKAKEIRTIIKGRGLWYPNVEGTAKATFRTDKYHHLMSMASMLGPSPDWLVGVSDINLCLADCTWSGERSFDLFPFDAGTDNGVTYMSPNNPSVPRHRIQKITTTDPADPRAPFYTGNTEPMPPLARLTLRRVKLYPMQCKTDQQYQQLAQNATTSEDDEYKDRRECMTGEWTPWSLCSATCGKGIRMRSRVYKFPVKAQMFDCERQMTENQFCNAPISVCEDSAAFNEDCAATDWTQWTDCSVTCESGIRSRTRNYQDASRAEEHCSIDLAQTERCTGVSGDDCSVTPNPLCQTTYWSDWSPCTASCGQGMRVRTRLFYHPQNRQHCDNVNLLQEETCSVQTCERFYEHWGKEICKEDKVEGQCGGVFPRFYFDRDQEECKRFIYTGCKGNRNRFETEDQCRDTCIESYHSEQKAIEWYDVNGCAFCCMSCADTNTQSISTTTTMSVPVSPPQSPLTTPMQPAPGTTKWSFYPFEYYVTTPSSDTDTLQNTEASSYNFYQTVTEQPNLGTAQSSAPADLIPREPIERMSSGARVHITATILRPLVPLVQHLHQDITHYDAQQYAFDAVPGQAGRWLDTILDKATDSAPAANYRMHPVSTHTQIQGDQADPHKAKAQWAALRSLALRLRMPELLKHYDERTGKVCLPANDLLHAMGVSSGGSVNDGGEPVPCMVTEWSPWTPCSATCGRGRRMRNRSIKVLPRNGGRACPDNMQQKRRCQMRPCPNSECSITNWSSWTRCSVTCGEGTMSRFRRIIKPRGHHNDHQCQGATAEHSPCTLRQCLQVYNMK